MRLKLTVMCGVVLTALISAKSAQAEGRCPSGSYPVGGGNAGWEGCAPIPGSSSGGGTSSSESTYRTPMPVDPAMIRLLDAHVERAQFEAKYGKILFHNPKVGVWLMTSAGDGTGKNCAASYFAEPKQSNIVSFIGPNKQGAGAMLFLGTGMPASRDVKEIQPALTFKGAKPLPLDAVLMPYGKTSGILVLADMVGMMRNAKSESEVTLQLDGKEVFRADMTGFLTARSAMLKCMRAE